MEIFPIQRVTGQHFRKYFSSLNLVVDISKQTSFRIHGRSSKSRLRENPPNVSIMGRVGKIPCKARKKNFAFEFICLGWEVKIAGVDTAATPAAFHALTHG